MEGTLELGGNIALTGFNEVDRGEMVVVKKIVGNYAKKFSEAYSDFQKLSLTMKSVHKTEGSQKYEMHSMLVLGGNQHTSETTDRNLFIALDTVLKGIEKSVK